jgi:hypothetical protein
MTGNSVMAQSSVMRQMIVLPLAIHVVEETSAMKLPIAVTSREYVVTEQ